MNLNMKSSQCPPPLVSFLLAQFISTLLLSSSQSLRDSIGENQILKDDETLVSKSGVFVLGFFNGNNTNVKGSATKNRYLGLWYNFSTDIIVWVANRENPVTKSFAALQLNENGHLQILQGQSSNMLNTTGDVEVVWSSNSSTLVSNTKATNQIVAKLSNSGNLRVTNGFLIWQSFDYPTNTYLPGEFTLGCQREERINCSDEDVFLEINNMKLPDTTNSTIDKNMSLSTCRVSCKNNCSCVAYAPLYLAGFSPRGCIMWFGDLMDTTLLIQDGQDLYFRSKNSLLPNNDSAESQKKPAIIGAVSAGVLIILSSFGILLWMKAKKRNTRLKRVISSATDNFSSDNKIGQGGFASVYKGTMPDGMDIAVKRLSNSSGKGLGEFMNEVILIAKLQHKNLVQLLGCCMEGDERILVFEFMENKSLDIIIFGEKRNLLDWPKRAEIIKGIARGLLYLHQDSRLKIIHRDLKAANILLDDAMNPKITDFGIARLFGADQMEDNTGRIIGTYGYMSPEYASGGNFSIKSDVFSFGVLLLEIVSGTKNRLYYKYDSKLNLLEKAWVLYNDQKTIMLLDDCLSCSCSISEVVRFIKIGLLCVQDLATDRPTMFDVFFMLINDIAILQEPKRPAFFNDRKLKPSVDCLNSTNNDVTFTRIVGR